MTNENTNFKVEEYNAKNEYIILKVDKFPKFPELIFKLHHKFLRDLSRVRKFEIKESYDISSISNLLENSLLNKKPIELEFKIEEINEIIIILSKHNHELYKFFTDTGNFFEDFKNCIVLFDKEFKKELMEIGEKLIPAIGSFFQSIHKLEFVSDYFLIDDKESYKQKNIEESLNNLTSLDSEKFNEGINKYKWLITPSMPLDLKYMIVRVSNDPLCTQEKIDNVIKFYFMEENYINLDKMINKWENNPFIKSRLKIIRDCVKILKTSEDKEIACNVIIPTLIAQIDGIQLSYMKDKGVFHKPNTNNKAVKLRNTSGNEVKWREEWNKIVEEFEQNNYLDETHGTGTELFLNILYQNTYPGLEPDDPFILSRNKIIHGEYLNYGKVEIALRAFLIIEYLNCFKEKTKIR